MSFQVGHTPSQKGISTTVDPVKSLDDLNRIKTLVSPDVRLNALWNIAVNSALRASDLVRLTWADVADDGERFTITTLETKTSKRRVVPLSASLTSIIRAWRDECCFDHVFSGQRGQMTVGSWGRIVKDLCEQVGLEGRFSSHTCRKTFVRLQYDVVGTSLPTLMTMLNHSTERQTLQYMGRLSSDVMAAYSHAL